jgi:hypothetical protein
MPALLRATTFGAAPAGRPILEAIEYVRTVLDEKRRPGPPPTAFVPDGWMRQVLDHNGAIDMTGYRLGLLDRMRAAIRRRDLFVGPSFRYSDPRKGLLEGAAWEAARPAVCRTLGVSSKGSDELQRLSQRLDQAFRQTAANLPTGPASSMRFVTPVRHVPALRISRRASALFLSPRLAIPDWSR